MTCTAVEGGVSAGRIATPQRRGVSLMPSLVSPLEYLILLMGLGAAIVVGIGAFIYALFKR